MRIIALEEAFLHPALRELYPASYLKSLDVLKGRLFDVGPERIRRMDAAGIDLQVLSHIQPGVQMLDGQQNKNALEKHMWRDMSESWLGMIGCAEREDFAAEEREHGTNQSQSKSSH